jgi:hypothetical protein
MPWTSSDAQRFTHKADTPGKRRQWAKVANRILRQTGDEKRAIRVANWIVGVGIRPTLYRRK